MVIAIDEPIPRAAARFKKTTVKTEGYARAWKYMGLERQNHVGRYSARSCF